ncbi:MAG: hypothetical protein DCC68_17860 [Planctomycetota bacterium]|nr:MAG: hypothetical protein DCC68_17860 [Planctomycetota bacterium]
MRPSKLWPRIFVDGDLFIEGFLGLTWCPSAEAKAARDKWENSVDNLIGVLTKKHVGWAVMKALHDSGHTLTIVPNPSKDCNATTYPESAQDAAKKGKEAEHCSKEAKGSNLGTGKGTSSKITFSPGQWVKNGQCAVGAAGRDGDEILLHEMCHAMRYAAGMRTSCFETPVGFGDYEELVAVTITNVFSSETNRTLRRDHEGFAALPATTGLFSKGKKVQVNLHDPQTFCNWFRPQMENIAKSHRAFSSYLASKKFIRWNPFAYV